MSEQTQPGDGKKLLQAPCAEEYTASLKCEAIEAVHPSQEFYSACNTSSPLLISAD